VSVPYHDLVIPELADCEAYLLERVASLEADVVAYRMLAQQAIHALHDVVLNRDRLRASHHRLLDEYRALRVQTLREDKAA
jgi:hypothetical protein